jgi:hypothetical protein
MQSSNIKLSIDLKLKCFMHLAKKDIVDNIEQEIEKNDNEELRIAFIEMLNDVLNSELYLSKPKFNKLPNEPVKIKGTPLKLQVMTNTTEFHNFCATIAKLSGYKSDFSDAPFNNLSKNARIYEAIRKLYISGNITQDILDDIVRQIKI